MLGRTKYIKTVIAPINITNVKTIERALLFILRVLSINISMGFNITANNSPANIGTHISVIFVKPLSTYRYLKISTNNMKTGNSFR